MQTSEKEKTEYQINFQSYQKSKIFDYKTSAKLVD